MARQKPAGIGRNRLCRELEIVGIPVTEGRMKSLLKRMRREGLVTVGATRQGTAPTARGEALLAYLTERAERIGNPY